ncbi:MAG: iron-containing alcohol dehydrogenase [Chloroflexota bacterium]
MNFEFATATRVVFGVGTLAQAAPQAATLGRRALLALGIDPARAVPLMGALDAHGVDATIWPVAGEPTVDGILQGVEQARTAGCDLVIALGGGSAIDTGKAIAALSTNPGDLFDYLEIVGHGCPLQNPGLPFIAVPTTAGTGAEVTRNAVIGAQAPDGSRVKVSLRSPLMLPRLAIVDAELTYTLPRAVTLNAGLDALTQVIEPFVSGRANPLTDALCRDAIGRAAHALPLVCGASPDPAARQDMALVSLFGGLALANAGLGAVHGFAGPLGGMLAAPHGALCARLLPFVVRANVHALQSRQPEHPSLARYAEVAALLTGRPQARAEDGAAWLGAFCADLGVAPLSAHGLRAEDIPVAVERAAQASSMKANPVALTQDELADILSAAM